MRIGRAINHDAYCGLRELRCEKSLKESFNREMRERERGEAALVHLHSCSTTNVVLRRPLRASTLRNAKPVQVSEITSLRAATGGARARRRINISRVTRNE